MRILKPFNLALLALAFSACARLQDAPVVEKVYIPTPCKVEQLTKPQKSGEVVEDLKRALLYSEELSRALDFCTRGNE